MSDYGIKLRDKNGYVYYDSTGEDIESILILDVFTIHTSSQGSKAYADLYGGAENNIAWMLFPRNELIRQHRVYRAGNTIYWEPPSGGSSGYTDVVVTIK